MADDISCPHCGHNEFYIFGLVGYKLEFNGERPDYRQSEIQWDVNVPEYLKCRGCDRQITEYAIEKGIFSEVYKVVARDPTEPVEDPVDG